jgi:hypothetical protein
MTNLQYLYDRVKIGIDAHPSDNEVKELISLAKEINPKLEWAVKGCQSCVKSLILFVFETKKVDNANKKRPL